MAAKPILYCSFCGKAQHEVLKLIAGPDVFICDECITLCMDIMLIEGAVKQPYLGPDLGAVVENPPS